MNLPTAQQVAVIDDSSGKTIAKWGPWLAAGNFPMALDDAGDRLFVGYRWPAFIVAISTATGEILNKVSSCSRPEWTARQYAYARAMGHGDSVYTPQVIVNGKVEGDGTEPAGFAGLVAALCGSLGC